ncbi:MAG: FtsK/SpoIIIE domain-containing protein, partial [Oscillospiraceae bacterium]
VGIEVPNKTVNIVNLREVIESSVFTDAKEPLTFALGKDISGAVQVGDIAKMPHLLIAGSTGMGKSVCINSMLVSMLYKCAPKDLQLVLIDPKMVEFQSYNGIPHLLTPVVTDPRKAAGALGWAVGE